MRVNVCPEFCGSARFRLTFRFNGRMHVENVRADKWSRSVSTEALDIFQYVYKVPRSRVRFIHH